MRHFMSFFKKTSIVLSFLAIPSQGMETASLGNGFPEGFPDDSIDYIYIFCISPENKDYNEVEKNFRLVCRDWKIIADRAETDFYKGLNQTHGFLPWTEVAEGAVQTPKAIYRSNILCLRTLGYARTFLWISKNVPDIDSLYDFYDCLLPCLLSKVILPELKQCPKRFFKQKIFTEGTGENPIKFLLLLARVGLCKSLKRTDLEEQNHILETATTILESAPKESSLTYHNECTIYYYAQLINQMFNSDDTRLPSMKKILGDFVPSNTALGRFLTNHDEVMSLRSQILDAHRNKHDPDLGLFQRLRAIDDGYTISDMIYHLHHAMELTDEDADSLKSYCDKILFTPNALASDASTIDSLSIYECGLTYYQHPQMRDLFLRFSIAAMAKKVDIDESKYREITDKLDKYFIEKGKWDKIIHWNIGWMICAVKSSKSRLVRSVPYIQEKISGFMRQFLEANSDNTLDQLINLVEGGLIQQNHSFRPGSYDYMMKCIAEGTMDQQDANDQQDAKENAKKKLRDLWTMTVLGLDIIPLTLRDIETRIRKAEDANDLESVIHLTELASEIDTQDMKTRYRCYCQLSQLYGDLGNQDKAELYKGMRMDLLRAEDVWDKNTDLLLEDTDDLIAVYERLGNREKVAACIKNRASKALNCNDNEGFITFMEQIIKIPTGKVLYNEELKLFKEISLKVSGNLAKYNKYKAYASLNTDIFYSDIFYSSPQYRRDRSFVSHMKKAINLSDGKCLNADDYNLLADVCERLEYKGKAIMYRIKGKTEELLGFLNFG